MRNTVKSAEMDNNKKSLIKNTILGLLVGGSAASIYTLMNIGKDNEADDPKNKDNVIQVPLSRANFMRAVGRGKEIGSKNLLTYKKEAPALTAPAEKIPVEEMTSAQLADLKRSLLRNSSLKAASASRAPQTINGVETGSTVEAPVKNIGSSKSTRDSRGRFSTPSGINSSIDSVKTAKDNLWDNTKGQFYDIAGFTGGMIVGSAGMKMLFDKILVNRKKKEVEKARKTYVNLINKEINDVDEPYYTKQGSMRKKAFRNFVEEIGGTALGIGAGALAVSALVSYKILENRRKDLEAAADKDTSKYPKEKSIEFNFA